MKYINYKFFAILILLVIIASCKKDKYQDYSKLTYNNDAYVTPFSVIRKECEGALDIPFKFVDGGQIVDMNFEVSIVGGTATEGDDYDLITHDFTIDAFKDSAAISLDIYSDEELEEDETIIIRVKEYGNGNNSPIDSVDITVTIVNTGTTKLDLEFAWDKDVIFDTDTFSACDNFDIDVYVLDEDGVDMGIYNAVTGNCPEGYILDLEGAGPITFYFAANLYLNSLKADYPTDNTPIPITTTINRIAGGTTSFTQTDANAYKVSSDDYENDGDESFHNIAKVVFDGQCTILIYNTDTDASTELRKKKLTSTSFAHKK